MLADRFWPLWLASLHLLTVGVHGVRVYDPGLWGTVYTRSMGLIGWVMLAVLAVGTLRHRRRVLVSGSETDWTHQRERGDERPLPIQR